MDNFTLFRVSQEELRTRLKSWVWRVSMMALMVTVDFLLKNLNVVIMPEWLVAVLGLALGEVSKQLNKNLTELRGVAMGKIIPQDE